MLHRKKKKSVLNFLYTHVFAPISLGNVKQLMLINKRTNLGVFDIIFIERLVFL